MDISHGHRVEVAGWTIETLERLGHADLIDVITIEWNGRFTNRMGDALYKRAGSLSMGALDALRGSLPGSRRFNHAARRVNTELAQNGKKGPQARIRFSIPLWPRASHQERHETVIHEVCHIVANHEAATERRRVSSSHGWEWRALMRKCGLKPNRCHNVDRTGLKRTTKKISASCGCGTHDVTPYVAGRIAAGCAYTCRKCRKHIVVNVTVAPVAKRRGGRRRRYRR